MYNRRDVCVVYRSCGNYNSSGVRWVPGGDDGRRSREDQSGPPESDSGGDQRYRNGLGRLGPYHHRQPHGGKVALAFFVLM